MNIKFSSKFQRNALFCMLAATLCGLLAACGEPKFKINGEITDGPDVSVILEKADFAGEWMPLDSTRTDSKGHFSFSHAAPASPEIYRLQAKGRYIYLPVDSVETINMETTAADFGHKFTLSGTQQAELMAEFEQALLRLDFADAAKVEAFKRDVYNNYLKESQGSILSYYVLTKTIDGKPLYDPSNASDARYFAAVATAFDQYRPTDPHGRVLHQVALQSLKDKNRNEGKRIEVNAEEVVLLEIALPDEKGTEKKLSDVAGNGTPVVVIMAPMNENDSPEFNLRLSNLYSKYSGRVDFFHVSFDDDRYAWRDAASNLPWTTVFDNRGLSSPLLRQYNVGRFPVFFIYNASGELSDRADSIDELAKKLSSY